MLLLGTYKWYSWKGGVPEQWGGDWLGTYVEEIVAIFEVAGGICGEGYGLGVWMEEFWELIHD